MRLLAAPLLLALTAQAAPPVAPAPVAAPVPAGAVQVTVATSAGPIVLALDKEHAPVTVANFLRYVDSKRLDGVAFYRAVKVAEGYGLIQFGVRNDPRRLYPPIAHEPTTSTGLSHLDGTISMAMAAPGTASGDFFITVGDLKSMDADTAQPGFAAFGRVVQGMDIVRRILVAPTSPTAGEGVMKGQMLEPTVAVTSVRRSTP